MLQKNPSNLKISVDPGKISKFDKRRAFNKAVGPGKNPKSIYRISLNKVRGH